MVADKYTAVIGDIIKRYSSCNNRPNEFLIIDWRVNRVGILGGMLPDPETVCVLRRGTNQKRYGVRVRCLQVGLYQIITASGGWRYGDARTKSGNLWCTQSKVSGWAP